MKKFITQNEAVERVKELGEDFIVIQNPDYIFPEFEIVPLAPKFFKPPEKISAIVMDMDGTTTTTEELCIHSLEFMVRQMSGRLSVDSWSGLTEIDYPFIIGNSTTKHVEYLINKYSDSFRNDSIMTGYFLAIVKTLSLGKDEGRKEEVRNNLYALNCGSLLENNHFLEFISKDDHSEDTFFEFSQFICGIYSPKINLNSLSDFVRVGIDIYYQKYHEILHNLKNKILVPNQFHHKKNLIEPMAGIGIFIAMIKGLLGDKITNLYPLILEYYKTKCGKDFIPSNEDEIKSKLKELSLSFVGNPAKLAVVTSSIFYEADIVLSEVFSVLQKEVDKWDLPSNSKTKIAMLFSDYHKVYDAVVSASDSNEIRLKPHRDLYSIALHKLSIPKNDFNKVIGFEDSESGTIAIRAAGINRCIAVPFAQTTNHDFSAATFIANGGLPQTILEYLI